MRTNLKTARLLLLGLWLGAAVFFGAAVAPNVFAVLRGAHVSNANEIAGTIITRLLSIINISGCAIALFGIATAYFVQADQSRRSRSVEVISLAIMAMMTGVSNWVISARMLALRAAMQTPIDLIARDDPRRVAFDSLHRYSVAVMGVAVIAALIVFLLISIQSLRLARQAGSR